MVSVSAVITVLLPPRDVYVSVPFMGLGASLSKRLAKYLEIFKFWQVCNRLYHLGSLPTIQKEKSTFEME